MIIHHGLVVIWSDVVKFKKWFKNHSEHHCCTILFSNGIKIALNYKVTCNLQLFEDQKCFTTFATNRSSRFTMTLLLSTFIKHYSIIRVIFMQIYVSTVDAIIKQTNNISKNATAVELIESLPEFCPKLCIPNIKLIT